MFRWNPKNMNMQIVNMSFEEWKTIPTNIKPLNETKNIDDEDYQIHWGALEENDLLRPYRYRSSLDQ